ncbi:hypothetical protein TNCT_652241 [Trichonephila clavata]|uniref:DUF4817 domain-containing protein n=1 Tax=Trichonephila clavata TaxID=2740835 RepID=A0A8X6GEP9_TRICU|nr:hypothetical protein TNCT_652241 [Trichonephila clavata]
MNLFTHQGFADMHLAYVAAGESVCRARQIYENRYPNKRRPQHQMFARGHRNLGECVNCSETCMIRGKDYCQHRRTSPTVHRR